MTFAVNMSNAKPGTFETVPLEGSNMRLLKDKFAVVEPDLTTKSILVGSSGVGKSALLMRFTKNEFSPSFVSTVGVDYSSVMLQSAATGQLVRSCLWDSAGQDRFSTIVATFFRGIHAVALCFDITDAESFDDIHKWVQKTNQFTSGDVPFLLVGTKADLAAKRQVPVEAAQRLAQSLDAEYIETSAKCGNNVAAAFARLTERAIEQKVAVMKRTQGNNSMNTRSGIGGRVQLGAGAAGSNTSNGKSGTGPTCAC